jgi:hypothetical protein
MTKSKLLAFGREHVASAKEVIAGGLSTLRTGLRHHLWQQPELSAACLH